MRGGGFAVGAGDGDDGGGLRTVKLGGQQGESATWVVVGDERNAFSTLGQFCAGLRQYGGRAIAQGIVDELASVCF